MAPSNEQPSRRPTVLFLAACPPSLDELDLEGERDAIESELNRVGLTDVLRLVHRSATTPSALQSVMLEEQPTVVHFSGHGCGTSSIHPSTPQRTGIMLCGDGDDEIAVASGKALGDLFSKAGAGVQLVFLNACYSVEQADALLEHVASVIGVEGEITDKGAKSLSAAFYRTLAHGRTIQTSFEFGVNALMLGGPKRDVRLPVLRHREGTVPAQTGLVATPKGPQDSTWDVFVAYCPEDREEVYPLAVALHDRKLRVFFAEWELGLGTAFSPRLEEGVRSSAHGLIAMSPKTAVQGWFQQQYTALLNKAVTEKKLLIPVLVGNAKVHMKLPPFLETIVRVDLRGKTGETYKREIDRIASALRGQPPGPPPRGG